MRPSAALMSFYQLQGQQQGERGMVHRHRGCASVCWHCREPSTCHRQQSKGTSQAPSLATLARAHPTTWLKVFSKAYLNTSDMLVPAANQPPPLCCTVHDLFRGLPCESDALRGVPTLLLQGMLVWIHPQCHTERTYSAGPALPHPRLQSSGRYPQQPTRAAAAADRAAAVASTGSSLQPQHGPLLDMICQFQVQQQLQENLLSRKDAVKQLGRYFQENLFPGKML